MVLLLGVGYDRCTCFHLAEYRIPDPSIEATGAAVLNPGGTRHWQIGTDVVTDDDDFLTIGEHLEITKMVRSGPVGSADCKLFSLPAAVEHASSWMTTHRRGLDPTHGV